MSGDIVARVREIAAMAENAVDTGGREEFGPRGVGFDLETAADALSSALLQVQALTRALEPFAFIAKNVPDDRDGADVVQCLMYTDDPRTKLIVSVDGLTAENFRAAAAALRSLSKEEGETKLLDRLAELDAISEEEGIAINDASRVALLRFSNVFGEPMAVFLLDSGNYRARWHSETWSTSAEFLGAEARILHLPRRLALESKEPGNG